MTARGRAPGAEGKLLPAGWSLASLASRIPVSVINKARKVRRCLPASGGDVGGGQREVDKG